MGDVTFNPLALLGVRVNSNGADFSTEAGIAVTKHVESGGFDGFFSAVPSFSYTGGEKRFTGSATLTGMLVWPLLTSIGPRITYNMDKKQAEVGAMACAQTLIPATSDIGFFGGLCFTANDLSDIKGDGISGLFTMTGEI